MSITSMWFVSPNRFSPLCSLRRKVGIPVVVHCRSQEARWVCTSQFLSVYMSPLLRVYLIFLFPLLVNECLLRSTYSCPKDHYNVEKSVIVARYSTPSSNHSKSWRRRILSSSWFDFCLPLMSIDCSSPSVPRNPLHGSSFILSWYIGRKSTVIPFSKCNL